MTAESREAIMEATFAALCAHGYADLTMAAIAAEFDKSKSLIHYHYDSKDELMVAFLDWLLEHFLAEVRDEGGDDPVARLRRMAEIVVVGSGADARDFHTALLELRAQAPYDPVLQAQLVANDREIRAMIADTVREAIASGQFRSDVDPERFAAAFRAAIEGAQSHAIILGEDAPTDRALEGIERLTIDALVTDARSAGANPAGEGPD